MNKITIFGEMVLIRYIWRFWMDSACPGLKRRQRGRERDCHVVMSDCLMKPQTLDYCLWKKHQKHETKRLTKNINAGDFLFKVGNLQNDSVHASLNA